MEIVNITNSYQAYINLPSIMSSQEFQFIVLGFGLLAFTISFILSIILMMKDNTLVADSSASNRILPKNDNDNIKVLLLKLSTAFANLEAAKSLLINLDDLKSNNVVNDNTFETKFSEYKTFQHKAADTISSIKNDIKQEMKTKTESRNNLEKSLNEITVEGTTKHHYTNNEKYYNNKIDTLNREISLLQSLLDANGSHDIQSINK